MRPRFCNERFFSEPVTRCVRRRTWGETVLALLTLLGLAVLCGWLWSVVRDAVPNLRTEVSALPFMPLAMAPVSVNAVIAVTMTVATGLMFWAIAAMRQNGQWIEEERGRWRELRSGRVADMADPLASMPTVLTSEDMHRILTACAAEGREIRRLMVGAASLKDLDDRIDVLETATHKMHILIGCVEGLCERLQPTTEKEEVRI